MAQNPGLRNPSSTNAATATQFGGTNMPIGRALNAALMYPHRPTFIGGIL
jgi:hypothetical protein